MLKLIKPKKAPKGLFQPSHAEAFLERYVQLTNWALQLTENRQQAEDIVHDAYVHFTLGLPDLGMENLDGYLRRILHNIYVSHLRRKACSPVSDLPVADYDSAEIGLRGRNVVDRMQTRQEILLVCEYACSRKETSKAGSILILRFLHGYYPDEIAKVLRISRQAVEYGLWMARQEAKFHVQNVHSPRSGDVSKIPQTVAEVDFLSSLRQIIFEARTGECLKGATLSEIYKKDQRAPVPCETLSHVVSCPDCLDQVNKTLDLPLLSDRNPTDSIGPDRRWKGGSGDGPSCSGTGGKGAHKCEHKAKDVFEHQPRELYISVNGHHIQSQKIASELDLSLCVSLPEPVGFVEIFSEQGIRLLLLSADSVPDGAVEQRAQVDLSHGRTLSVSLDFSSWWPNLRLQYQDPELGADPAIARAEFIAADMEMAFLPRERQVAEVRPAADHFWPLVTEKWRSFGGSVRLWWWKPALASGLAMIFLAGALLLSPRNATELSGEKLLKQSVVAEQAILSNPGRVVHRTVSLEERKPATGQILARHRIESWQKSEKNAKALRLYDDKNQLIAGEWVNPDGSSKVYRKGDKLLTLAQSPSHTFEHETIWQWLPSAEEFSNVVGRSDDIRVEIQPAVYILRYRNTGKLLKSGLVNASLTLRRNDLHVVEQTLVVNEANETREYRFTEQEFEQQASASVAPEMFEPDAVLLSSAAREVPPEQIYVPAKRELEVEVLQRLDEVHALIDEQLSLTRTPQGALELQGVVETADRKAEVMHALGALARNPALKLRVETVAEAQLHPVPIPHPGAITMENIEITAQNIPVDSELRGYFVRHGFPADSVDEEVRRFSKGMIDHSMRARLHAVVLKELVSRFSPAEAEALEAGARAEWRAMINEHARAFLRWNRELRQELEPIFPGLSGKEARGEADQLNSMETGAAVERLFQLAYSNDDAIGKSFRILSKAPQAAPINSPEFWRSLNSAEKLASKIVNNSSSTQQSNSERP